MKDGKIPNPNTINPISGYDKEIYIKPTIKNKNIKNAKSVEGRSDKIV